MTSFDEKEWKGRPDRSTPVNAAALNDLEARIGDAVTELDEAIDGAGQVASVNGETGTVVLDAADVGAAPASHTHAQADVTGLTAALAAKQDAASAATQAELDAHAADTTAVHGIADTSKVALWDAANPADTVISAVTGQPVLAGSGSASTVTFVPSGSIVATNVQAAIEEVAAEAGGTTTAQALADSGKRTRVPICNRLNYPSHGPINPSGNPDRATTSASYAVPRTCTVPATAIRLEWTNSTVSGSGETDGAGTLTIKAAIVVGSTIYPVTFSGGSTSGTAAPGARLESDIVAGLELRAGDVFTEITYVSTNGSAGVWPGTLRLLANSGNATVPTTVFYASGADTTATNTGYATSPANSSPYAFTASKITGTPPHSTKTVGIIGDSIAGGSSDTDTNKGFAVRALDAGSVPSVRLAISGNSYAAFAAAGDNGSKRRVALLTGISDVIFTLGTNDMRGGLPSVEPTLTNTKNSALESWRKAKAAGVQRVYAGTVTPYTTGTAGSQTAYPNDNAASNGFNDWLRDGAPATLSAGVYTFATTGSVAANVLRAGDTLHPLTSHLEITDHVETFRNSRVWQTAAFGDGTHPSSAGDVLMRRAIDPLKFGGAAAIPAASGYRVRRRAGQDYHAQIYNGSANFTIGQNYFTRALWCMPFYVDQPFAIDRMSTRGANTAATAGTTGRLMIYRGDSEGKPGTLVQDFGALPFDVTGAQNSAVLSTPLEMTEDLYFLTLMLESNPATRPNLFCGTGPAAFPIAGAIASPGVNHLLGDAGAGSGAPASLASASFIAPEGNAPLLYFRVSRSGPPINGAV